MSDENESWLPNLVGGVSIWKLAPDLNEEQFFDGRLLVPETEGSDSLPVRVEWDLTGLVPLPDARAKHGDRVEAAVKDFFACLERTAKVFEKGGSGYDKYKAAFTVPALDADAGAHYFFDPGDDKLKVINWGASPRKIRHEKHYLFGYQDFAALIRKAQEEEAARGGAGGVAAAEGAEASAEGASAEGAASDAKGANDANDEKKEEKKDDEEEKGGLWGKPWWTWALYLVVLAFLIWFAFALLRDCDSTRGLLGGDSADAGVDSGVEAPIYGHSTDDGGPAATNLRDGGASAGDAGVGADGSTSASDGGEASADAGAAGSDGGAGSESDGGGSGGGGSGGSGSGGSDGGSGSGSGGGGSGGGGSGGGGSGGGGAGPPVDDEGRPIYGEVDDPDEGHIYWAPGPGGSVRLPHREYYHPEAAQWRIVGGTRKVYDFSGAGSSFRVFLRPGETFDGVRVQWRDRAGRWHDH